VVEEQIKVEIFAINNNTFLAFDKCKTGA